MNDGFINTNFVIIHNTAMYSTKNKHIVQNANVKTFNYSVTDLIMGSFKTK